MTTDNKLLGIVLAAGKGSRMGSELPKVLHQVDGIPMVTRVIKVLREAGSQEICAVVGYRQDLIREELGDEIHFAVQDKQLGTGHAVASAREQIEKLGDRVLVVYGDAPHLSASSLRQLAQALDDDRVGASLPTITLNNPPQAGRIIRDEKGEYVETIEDQDCTDEQRKIGEINVGCYAFRSKLLLDALDQLRCDNAQGEYYLTDVPTIVSKMGHQVKIVHAADIIESLGVNDTHHLKFAESVKDIKHAESLYPVVDAAAEMATKRRTAE